MDSRNSQGPTVLRCRRDEGPNLSRRSRRCTSLRSREHPLARGQLETRTRTVANPGASSMKRRRTRSVVVTGCHSSAPLSESARYSPRSHALRTSPTAKRTSTANHSRTHFASRFRSTENAAPEARQRASASIVALFQGLSTQWITIRLIKKSQIRAEAVRAVPSRRAHRAGWYRACYDTTHVPT